MIKGLLLKDWYLLRAQFKILLFIPLIFLVLPFLGAMNDGSIPPSSLFFPFMGVLLLSMFPISVQSLDEQSRWESYAITMPYRRRDLVLSKYLLSLCGTLLGSVIFTVFYLVFVFLKGLPIDFSFLSVLVCLFFLVGSLYAVLIFPFVFRFGSEKGRLFFIFGAAAIGALGGGYMSTVGEMSALSLPACSSRLIMYLLPLLTLLLYYLSYRLSVHWYNQKEF